jgi:membrane protein
MFGATTVFYQLQISLNLIWGVVAKPKKAIMKYIRDRVFSFLLILFMGLLIMATIIVNTVLSAMGDWIRANLPDVVATLIIVANFLLPFVILTILLAMVFKILPDAIIRWRSVWIGAVITAILFGIGQWGMGIYFRMADPGSIYGAAGSIIVLLVWISYVAMILLFGAEFTRQWAIKFGYGITPKENAELIETSPGPYTQTE